MPEFRIEDFEGHSHLEPWEDEESRRRRNAWKGEAAEEIEVGESVVLPADVFRQLANAALNELRNQILFQQMRREIAVLRGELDQLRASVRGDTTDRTGSTSTGLLASLSECLAAVHEAFASTFGSDEVHLSIAPAPEDGEIAYSILVDATTADWAVIQSARATGARYLFYKRLARTLPSAVLEDVGFDFRFPPDPNA